MITPTEPRCYRTIDLHPPRLWLAYGWRTWLTLDHSNASGDTIQLKAWCCVRGHLTRGAAIAHGMNTQRRLAVAVDGFLALLTARRDAPVVGEPTIWDDFETGRAR